MTIELQPEAEALLRERMERDGFKSAEDLLAAMLSSMPETDGPQRQAARSPTLRSF